MLLLKVPIKWVTSSWQSSLASYFYASLTILSISWLGSDLPFHTTGLLFSGNIKHPITSMEALMFLLRRKPLVYMNELLTLVLDFLFERKRKLVFVWNYRYWMASFGPWNIFTINLYLWATFFFLVFFV